jgi:predicted transcriptional regulator
VSLSEILHEIDALPPEDRWQVLEHTRLLLETDIPAEFKEGMEAIARGETLDLDEAMPELKSE